MKLLSKVLIGVFVVSFGIFTFTQINNNKQIEQIAKQQEIAKAKREEVTGETYDGMQGYLDSFLGLNKVELEKELKQSTWKKVDEKTNPKKEYSYQVWEDGNRNSITFKYIADIDTLEEILWEENK